MSFYTYKVIPAPGKAPKVPGVKAPEARFALGLEEAINEMAFEGWEYLRADILPSEERQGLTSTQTVYRSVLVFRRAADTVAEAHAGDAQHTPAPPVHRPEDYAPAASSPEAPSLTAKATDTLRRHIPPLAGFTRSAEATPPPAPAPAPAPTPAADASAEDGDTRDDPGGDESVPTRPAS
jgi:hypothetical protein